MTTTNNVKNADGFPILGWLVNYTTEKGFAITQNELKDLLRKVGIDEAYATPVLDKNAAKRAFKAKAGGKVLHRTVSDESGMMVLALARADVDAQMKPEFNVQTEGYFDKSTRALVTKGSDKAELEQLFQDKKHTYAGDQFRSIVLRYVKRECLGIAYLETGNLYFVPSTKKAEIRRLQLLFGELQDRAKFIMKEEIDSASIRSIMWEVTVSELTANLQKLQEDFNEIGDEVTDRIMETRLRRYQELKTKAEMFEFVLSGKASGLKTELDKLSKKVREKLVT